MSSTTVPARASGAAASSASSASGQTSVKGSPVAAVEDCNPHRERVVQGIDPGRLAVREPIELSGQGLVYCPGAIRMAMAGVKKPDCTIITVSPKEKLMTHHGYCQPLHGNFDPLQEHRLREVAIFKGIHLGGTTNTHSAASGCDKSCGSVPSSTKRSRISSMTSSRSRKTVTRSGSKWRPDCSRMWATTNSSGQGSL